MTGLEEAISDYLVGLATRGYSTETLRGRRHHLASFSTFAADLGVSEPARVTAAVVASYQRHLYHHKKRDGQPLSFRTQAQRLIPIKGLFAHLTRTGVIAYDPAVSLLLPQTGQRLPEAVLSVEEIEAVLAGPDTTTATGLRDRAILEVLYSTAIRRNELIALRLGDIDHHRGTLFVRRGKGGRDRHVPIGQRALTWVQHYTDRARPALAAFPDNGILFVNTHGKPLIPNFLSKTVTAYVQAGAPTKHGSCHLFRHSCATLMLDNGADVRYVAEMLGHQKLETTMTYTRVSLTKLREIHAACHPAETTRRPAR